MGATPSVSPSGDEASSKAAALTPQPRAMSESYRVPGEKTRFAIIDYWGEDDSAEHSWSFHRQPVAFG